MTAGGSPADEKAAATREVVTRLLRAMFAGDYSTLRDLLCEDVVWHVPPSAAARVSDPIGADEVLEFMQRGAGLYYQPGSFAMEPLLEAAEADRCLVLARLRARTRQGSDYENLYAFGFRLREGRVCEVWELLDTAHFHEQMRG